MNCLDSEPLYCRTVKTMFFGSVRLLVRVFGSGHVFIWFALLVRTFGSGVYLVRAFGSDFGSCVYVVCAFGSDFGSGVCGWRSWFGFWLVRLCGLRFWFGFWFGLCVGSVVLWAGGFNDGWPWLCRLCYNNVDGDDDDDYDNAMPHHHAAISCCFFCGPRARRIKARARCSPSVLRPRWSRVWAARK